MEPTPVDAPATEVHATLRIDAQPAGKKFQGVWLEVEGGKRWVIDYRPSELWRGFEDAEVIATGAAYQPAGQAIQAPHFRVATLRFAKPPGRAVPYRSVGPERLLRGELVERVWPVGTRRAGEVERTFQTDEGASYGLAGGTAPTPGPAAITARTVEPDPAYAADTGGPKLFVIRVHPHAYTPERVR